MKPALYLVIVLGLYVLVGTLDFNDKLAAATERAQRAPKTATQNEARLWSKKCERRGKQILATQADGGKWVLKCVNADLKV
jgi:hypothetical protein